MMADLGSFDISAFKELQTKLNKLNANKEQFLEACIKRLAGELLRRTVKRTPVGYYGEKEEKIAKRTSRYKTGDKKGEIIHKKGDKYYVKKKGSDSGENGGNLRRGWRITGISKTGGGYKAVIENAVPYVVYVEYGHRQTPGRYVPTLGKRLVKSWVPGKFMLTISEQEVREIAPQILKEMLDKYLGVMK